MLRKLPESDALTAALLFAVNPGGLGGVVLRSLSGPDRDAWVAELRRLLPLEAPLVKVPVNVGFDRLLGGLDFAATVGSGKPVFSTGLIEAADGGVLCLAMAERIDDGAATIVAQALDTGTVRVEREGLTEQRMSRFGVLAFDEGMEAEEAVNAALRERLALYVTADMLSEMRSDGQPEPRSRRAAFSRDEADAARGRLDTVTVPEAVLVLLVQTALAFGVSSVRAELLAAEAARTAAALLGKSEAGNEEAALAARLVLAPRATRLPAEAPEQPPSDDVGAADDTSGEDERRSSATSLPDEMIVDAVRAAIPEGLLEMLAGGRIERHAASAGRSNEKTRSRRRGRPVGVRPSSDLTTSRLNLLATLKAAAPWQTLRGRGEIGDGSRAASVREQTPRLLLRREDLHVNRYQNSVETSTIFVVDASGSQAAQRLAEVKGAIELLLNDCYVRRDQVALIAFRGDGAETLLPPTRALARVKRSLASLPGGGATPLASGLDAARELAIGVARQGRIPVIVLLTDGRANIDRNGEQGAERAGADALSAASALRAEGFRILLVDTSRRPRASARELAAAMGALYAPLPFADAASISATVQSKVA